MTAQDGTWRIVFASRFHFSKNVGYFTAFPEIRMLRNPDHVLKGLVRGIRNDKPVKDKTEGGPEGHLQSSEGLCWLQKAEPRLGNV